MFKQYIAKLKVYRTVFMMLIAGCIQFFSSSKAKAQAWNPNFSVGTVSGSYSFAYNQVPDQLVEVFSAVMPVDVSCTYQWQQSVSPVFSTFSNAAGTSTQPAYTFSAPLTQTTYYRLAVTSAGTTVLSNVIKIAIVSTGWEDINYTREHVMMKAGVTNSWTVVDQLSPGQKMQTTGYSDGLGRVIQSVEKSAATPVSGNTWGDIVQPYEYDAYGRRVKDYLPYSTTATPGKFKAAAVADQAQYYSTVYGETAAYGTIAYDKSPLDQEMNVKEPGSVWQAGTGGSAAYDFNTSAENVQMFSVDFSPGAAPVTSGAYPANTLAKLTTTDQNGKQVIQYTDKAGRLILVKTQVSSSPSAAHAGWACVYRVYDDFGFLRCQLEPAAVNYLDTNGWSFAGVNGSQVLRELCSQYFYDDKGRVTWKKAPGTGTEQTIYDLNDHVLFTQDSNQAVLSPPQWTARIYDGMERPTMEVLYNTVKSVSSLQADIAANPANPISSADLANSSVTTILKYFYYDNYAYTGVKAFSTNFDNNTAYNPTGNPDVIPIASSKRVWDLQTGSAVRVLGTTNFLVSSEYYDEKGRHIQTIEDNILQGQDISTMQYSWDGRLLSTSRKHTAAGSGYTAFPVLTINKYDSAGRVSGIQQKLGSNAVKTVISYSYDDMGRLSVKTLDSTYTGAGKTNLEALAYSYNIHGQLTGINKNYALKATGYNKWAHFFGLYLGYDNKDALFATRQLDGHMAGQMWLTQGDDVQRKYDYSYDYAGKLINAAYNEQQQPGGGWAHTTMDFSVTGATGQITYDLNGNILSMVQMGVLPGNATPVKLDKLSYVYQSFSNKLSAVTDSSTAGSLNGQLGDFKDGSNTASTPDYVYDGNGNLVTDLNKAIGSGSTPGIIYNYLNKPAQVTINGKGTVTVVYDADGDKLQRTFTPVSGPAITTSYAGEFVYQSSSAVPNTNTLQYINFAEGRIRVIQPLSQSNGYDMLTIAGGYTLPNSTQGVYDFFILDQQENTRMILTEEVRKGINQCTMETGRASAEDPFFQGPGNEVENTRVPITTISGQSGGGGWHSNTSASVSQLGDYTGSFKMGPNVLLKVMAGDTINATTQYYFQASGSYPPGTPGLTQGVVSSIINQISGNNVATGAVKAGNAGIQAALTGSTAFAAISDPGTAGMANTSLPQAYLTVTFFDERFNYVGTGSQWVQVSQAGDNAAPLALANIQAPKNGYAFVYISNKSTQPVYFDNMKVGLNHGRIIEEDHYYAYGLKIVSLSSAVLADSAQGHIRNSYQYQASYAENDDITSWNEYSVRQYDPQIGRFIERDPFDQFCSPYIGMGGDPANSIDPTGGITISFGYLGDFTGSIWGDRLLATLGGATVGYAADKLTGGKGWRGAAIGAGLALTVTYLPQLTFDFDWLSGSSTEAATAATVTTQVPDQSLLQPLVAASIKASAIQTATFVSPPITAYTIPRPVSTSRPAPVSVSPAPVMRSVPQPPGVPGNVAHMGISEAGINFLTHNEGVVDHPYNDSRGFATIGIGHLIGNRPVTDEDRRQWASFRGNNTAIIGLFRQDLNGRYERAVRRLVHVPLTQAQYDAVVSFTFNVGIGSASKGTGLAGSMFLRELNAGRPNGNLMMRFRRPASIITRRMREVRLFNTGTY